MSFPRLRRLPAAVPVIVLALVLAVLLVSGCADQPADDASGGGDAGDTATDIATDGSTTKPPGGDGSMVAVGGVLVERGGGIAGGTETFQLPVDDPGAPDVLARAATLPTADEGEVSETPCCDIFTYTVTVQYAGGQTAQFHTYDGDEGPVFRLAMDVLALSAPTPETPPTP